MSEIINLFVSDTSVLTPGTVVEFFILFMILEFIGIMFSWVRGVGK